MVVIVIIGILATLAYSSLMEVIFVNRAKETAQTIRTFTEKALLDSKRQNKPVQIYIEGNAIKAKIDGSVISSESLSFSQTPDAPFPTEKKEFENNVESEIRIGLSGINKEGYFAVCGLKGYCGGAVKIATENSLKAYIRKGTGKNWEAL